MQTKDYQIDVLALLCYLKRYEILMVKKLISKCLSPSRILQLKKFFYLHAFLAYLQSDQTRFFLYSYIESC